ncbi:MAG: hypothetical protein ACE5ES_03115, partial [Candidatus Nanoarchaeia archaeon]
IKDTSLSPTELSECKTLSYNDEGSINMVFFSNKETAKKYSDSLLGFSPLTENKNKFNFYYIDDYLPECEIYEGIAVLCYNKDLIKKASSCPNDYIIVIKSEANKIRSSSYVNVMSINSNHPLTVLAHEFGHAFVPLAEEYVPAKIPSGSENCQQTCQEFPSESEINGCFEGCSNSDFKRSINAGIMRTLSSFEYGIFNEKLILEQIKKQTTIKDSITGLQIQEPRDCSNEKYHLIQGNYESGNMTLIEKSIEQGCVGNNGMGGFDYKLITKDDTTFDEGKFNPELIFTDAQSEKLNQENIEGETFENSGDFFLKIPSIPDSKSLEISKDQEIILEVNLQDIGSRFCKLL